PARRAARAESCRGAGPVGCSHDELLPLKQPKGGCIGFDESRRLLDHLVEHRRRVELAREEPAGARQLLRESARSALGLEQLAPLEGATRRVGEMTGKLEVVV